MKKLLFTLFASASFFASQAQQTSPSDHYLVHQYLVNPAAAGRNGTAVFMDYRRQWSGFNGAPETQIVTVDGSVNREKIGVGIMVVNDQVKATSYIE